MLRDGETGRAWNEDNPVNVKGDQACKAEWDLFADPIKAGSQSQRHTKAEDKTAPGLHAETSNSRLQRGSNPDKTIPRSHQLE